MNPSSARGRPAAALPAAFALILGVAACDRSNVPSTAETAAPAAESVDAVTPAPEAETGPVTNGVVAPTAASATPGDGVPVFAVLYPGAEVDETGGVASTGPAGPGGLVTFVTDDAPDAVVAFYRQRAEASGLTSTMAMNQGDARAYGAAQGAEDGASVQVVASPDGEGRTSVQLAWSQGR